MQSVSFLWWYFRIFELTRSEFLRSQEEYEMFMGHPVIIFQGIVGVTKLERTGG